MSLPSDEYRGTVQPIWCSKSSVSSGVLSSLLRILRDNRLPPW
jgi:hypothetical protein